jgi:hypothetical protein
MRIGLEYPALAFGETAKMSKSRLVLCVVAAEFDIDEADWEDAPLAFTVDGEPEIHYRRHGRQLYTPFEKGDAFLLGDSAASPLDTRHPLFGPAVTAIKQYVGHKRPAEDTKPERLFSALSSTHDNAALVRPARETAAKLVDNEATSADLAKWEAVAKRAVADLLLVDGRVWRRTPEPCYQVDLSSGRINAADSDLYWMTPELAGRGSHWGWDGLEYRYFAADDVDGALACASRFAPRVELQRSITVHDADAIGIDYHAFELDRAARVCVELFERHLSKLNGKEGQEMWSVPSDLLDAWVEMRACVRGREIGSAADEVTVSAVEAFCDALDANASWAGDFMLYDVDPAHARDVVGSWCHRPVDLGLALGGQRP